MTTSYNGWSLEKLKKEATKIEKAIKSKESKAKKNVIAELKAVAKKNGFDLKELLATDSPKSAAAKKHRDAAANSGAKPATKSLAAKRTRAKPPIKYRNPTNHEETWTGRGRQPRWVAAHLNGGGSLEDLGV